MSSLENRGLLAEIQSWCEHTPLQPAIRWRERTVMYSELAQRCGSIRTALEARRSGSPFVVAVLLEDRIEGVCAMLGIFAADGVFAALDPELPDERLTRLLEELQPACILAQTSTVARAQALRPGAEVLNVEDLSPSSSAMLAAELDEDALRYICFTSGSTGRPKGIAGRLKGLAHFVRWEADALQVREGVRVSHLSPPTFDVTFRDVLLPLTRGGCVCIPPERPALMTGSDLVAWLEAERVEVVHCVPSLFSGIAEAVQPGTLPDLKHVLLAGESIPTAIIRKWTSSLGWRVQLMNLYGPSETTMVKFAHTIRPEDLERGFIPIGRPIPGARAILLDNSGNPCPPGVVGEIHIRTPYMSLGYYRQPEATRQAFIPNPFGSDPADLVYKTGDLARVLADGTYQFLGRRDGQVKIRGNRVELGEIENQLLQCPHVRQAAVTVFHEGERDNAAQLAAYVVGGAELNIDALRQELRRRLPEYMVPASFTVLPKLPLTATGKLDRSALPSPAAAECSPVVDEAPATPVEQSIADIWKEVLKLPNVGVHANFFDLGGHSLLATQVVARIRRVFGVELQVRALFERPTIAGLAIAVMELQALNRDDIAGLLAEVENAAADK
ncbi:MAG TPA: non-ribosomal peptide synthetase [Planctomycetota bacterium]|nr:non-ribosomal peptide synthetase [Planctomycetota bacterium]